MSTSSSYTPSLSSLGSGTPLQITGLASGLDTNSIIQELMSVDKVPVTNLTNKQNALKALNTQLTSIQSSLQTVALNAQALGDPGLFGLSQTVSSSNSSLVSASTTSTGAGAVVGSYQVAVTRLATPSQRTVTFTSPANGDTFTIDGHQVTLGAKASAQDFVNAINSDPNATVWATVTASDASTGNGMVVLSDRATGAPATDGQFITIDDASGTVRDQASAAVQGVDAQYTINGQAPSVPSHSNTISNAIPGVTLNLNALTTGNGPVTINVGAPAPSTASITSAVQSFVNSYNSIIDQLNTQLTQTTSTSDPTQGQLFGDNELEGLLSDMRQTMYTSLQGLTGFTSLADLGITTGAPSGSATYSQDSVEGKLTIDTTKLTNAIQSNPSGVEAVLQGWSQSFSSIVNAVAQTGGTLDARIQGDSSLINDIGNQIDALNSVLTDRQNALTEEFANLESTLSEQQSESQWLSSQIASLG